MIELSPPGSFLFRLRLIATHKGTSHKKHEGEDDCHKEASHRIDRIVQSKIAIACCYQRSHNQYGHDDRVNANELIEHNQKGDKLFFLIL